MVLLSWGIFKGEFNILANSSIATIPTVSQSVSKYSTFPLIISASCFEIHGAEKWAAQWTQWKWMVQVSFLQSSSNTQSNNCRTLSWTSCDLHTHHAVDYGWITRMCLWIHSPDLKMTDTDNYREHIYSHDCRDWTNGQICWAKMLNYLFHVVRSKCRFTTLRATKRPWVEHLLDKWQRTERRSVLSSNFMQDKIERTSFVIFWE